MCFVVGKEVCCLMMTSRLGLVLLMIVGANKGWRVAGSRSAEFGVGTGKIFFEQLTAFRFSVFSLRLSLLSTVRP